MPRIAAITYGIGFAIILACAVLVIFDSPLKGVAPMACAITVLVVVILDKTNFLGTVKAATPADEGDATDEIQKSSS